MLLVAGSSSQSHVRSIGPFLLQVHGIMHRAVGNNAGAESDQASQADVTLVLTQRNGEVKAGN